MFLLVDRIFVERYAHIEYYYNTFYNMHAILVSLSVFWDVFALEWTAPDCAVQERRRMRRGWVFDVDGATSGLHDQSENYIYSFAFIFRQLT